MGDQDDEQLRLRSNAAGCSGATAPKKRYTVTLEVEAPAHVSYQHVRDWARFELHDHGSLELSNPLCDTEIDPIRFDIKESHR